MKREEVFNFSAGPSVLPTEVLEIAGKEILNYNGSGMSVMEMSHRSKVYLEIFESVKSKMKSALSVPESHEVLFLQGGASLQFSAIPMNLMSGLGEGSADYAVTGNFSNIAYKEAKKYGTINLAASSEDKNHTYIPGQSDLKLSPDADYFYYCANNTIYGTEWQYVPETGSVPVCCDMSSNILSKPVDVSKYGIIFAGAQKNMAPAGLTVVIIDKSLAGREMACTPLVMSYKTMIDNNSMYNTPPCWNIYILGLVLDWLEKQGGTGGMEKIKKKKAALVYDCLDSSSLFKACAEPGSRSDMNVTFRTGDDALDDEFCKGATKLGLTNLKGHRKVGGMRASIYNAMPMEGVVKLVEYMKKFEVENRV
ncbi:MAG: 3-phosphoserine/phosphohydroxythreonine transaminase [Oscillospiraceae bacterium]|nr:3-phosphoserine/phosphohydroxythreonine transaminase [Oscillospiraceae bacterium]